MARPACSYEELSELIPRITAHSTTPVKAGDINPLIKQVLAKCPRSFIKNLGGHSAVLFITDGIVAKIPFKAGDLCFDHEQNIFSMLDPAPSLHIVRTFLCRPEITFMQFISNGTLKDRIDEGDGNRPAISWMHQLSSAVAYLESFGLAHGDMKPANILVDDQDQLKLVDLGHAKPIGSDVEVGDDPYVRAHKVGEPGGCYGVAGPETEHFALGSVFWYITRGTELYSELQGHDVVNRLADRQFPDTDPDDPIDNIILKCWLTKFERAVDLLHEIERSMSDEKYLAKKELCEGFHSLLLEDGSHQAVKIATTASLGSANESAPLSLSGGRPHGTEISLYLRSV
ncbi:kinase-like domain-containing protein [Leptodontidium sp. MPI-SDFR-AT-0119]|nr:kinase-like domain-containing protein [Leptodontidium sp. MPI-SDFR-AT-0119]